ncbi:hypothetical protein PAPYR_11910 [Paratrimastix pyriformis]|uniref:Uncharacterized protein n=1 Tax=Paratrimastix pyriformis TaxID=342808 RepID=A0ABQ8U7L0_9EUKA|nr:hypothetical protein PAPYR_11910 [Paratrimastix pyriformis]
MRWRRDAIWRDAIWRDLAMWSGASEASEGERWGRDGGRAGATTHQHQTLDVVEVGRQSLNGSENAFGRLANFQNLYKFTWNSQCSCGPETESMGAIECWVEARGGWVGSESLLFVGIVGIEGPLSAANCQTQIIRTSYSNLADACRLKNLRAGAIIRSDCSSQRPDLLLVSNDSYSAAFFYSCGFFSTLAASSRFPVALLPLAAAPAAPRAPGPSPRPTEASGSNRIMIALTLLLHALDETLAEVNASLASGDGLTLRAIPGMVGESLIPTLVAQSQVGLLCSAALETAMMDGPAFRVGD